LVPSINTLFSKQSHCINCGGIRPFYFSLTGQQCNFIYNPYAGTDFSSQMNAYLLEVSYSAPF
ncbi:hypothetical protein, partial [Ketobacter sp.]